MTTLSELLNKSNMQFEHISLKNADGTAIRCRQSGRLKTWKRDKDKFKLPVKYGLKNSFYIDNNNCKEWVLVYYTKQSVVAM